jgi:hypothetical protein
MTSNALKLIIVFSFFTAFFPTAIVSLAPESFSVMADDGEALVRATISLGALPEPPDMIDNPGGVETIFWSIEYATTPEQVIFRLIDPDQTVIEETVYPGDTGMKMADYQWTVPNGSLPGAYHACVEYYSEQVGLEALAEVVFLVSEPQSAVAQPTWGKLKLAFK